MPKRNEKAILQDILFNLDAILKFTRNITFDDFVADIKTQYAVDRCFEIVGEATRQLPGEYITKHPEVE